MKKLFLLFASAVVASGVNAQVGNRSVVLNGEMAQKHNTLDNNIAPVRASARNNAANKGTAAPHTRVYNYVDFLNLSNADILGTSDYLSAPYMWYRPDMYAIYSGPTRDTIDMVSYAVTVHPQWATYNNPVAYPGDMSLSSTNAYTVDSIAVYGFYGRNRNKTTAVDTLRISYTYGDGLRNSTSNIYRAYYSSATLATRYNTDTVFSPFVSFDSAANKHILGKPASATNGATIFSKDILLRASDTANQRFVIPAGMSVPAGNIVGVAVTFRSGENYTPWDTVFLSTSVNPDMPYKYGMFRPFVYKESKTAFPTYSKTNYNVGHFKTLPDASRDYYSPTWAWSAGTAGTDPAGLQFPYVDVTITCATCVGVGVGNVPNNVTVGTAFPNPSATDVTLPITMKESANVNVALSNVMGQIVATQNLGQVSAKASKNVTFNTASLANGVYMLTVEANGARTTSRFVVRH